MLEQREGFDVQKVTISSSVELCPYLKSIATPPTGAVLYRIPLTWGQNKLPWKLLHATLMLLALVLSVVGLCAVFSVHNAKKIPNLYSLHSWIGIAATALFAIQVDTSETDPFISRLCGRFILRRDRRFISCECPSMQWVVGMAAFLLPCSPVTLRKLIKPVHVWFGGIILTLSIVACISGINEKLFFAL